MIFSKQKPRICGPNGAECSKSGMSHKTPKMMSLGMQGLNLPRLVHAPPLHAPQILIQNHQTITLTMQDS